MTMMTPDPKSDSPIDHAASIRYWNSIAADVDGMLGGYSAAPQLFSPKSVVCFRTAVPALGASRWAF